jgi:hypothetical protein
VGDLGRDGWGGRRQRHTHTTPIAMSTEAQSVKRKHEEDKEATRKKQTRRDVERANETKHKQHTSSTSHLVDAPTDVVVHAMSFLRLKDVAKLGMTCVEMGKLVKEEPSRRMWFHAGEEEQIDDLTRFPLRHHYAKMDLWWITRAADGEKVQNLLGACKEHITHLELPGPEVMGSTKAWMEMVATAVTECKHMTSIDLRIEKERHPFTGVEKLDILTGIGHIARCHRLTEVIFQNDAEFLLPILAAIRGLTNVQKVNFTGFGEDDGTVTDEQFETICTALANLEQLETTLLEITWQPPSGQWITLLLATPERVDILRKCWPTQLHKLITTHDEDGDDRRTVVVEANAIQALNDDELQRLTRFGVGNNSDQQLLRQGGQRMQLCENIFFMELNLAEFEQEQWQQFVWDLRMPLARVQVLWITGCDALETMEQIFSIQPTNLTELDLVWCPNLDMPKLLRYLQQIGTVTNLTIHTDVHLEAPWNDETTIKQLLPTMEWYQYHEDRTLDE